MPDPTNTAMKASAFLEASSSDVLPNRPALVGFPLDITSTYRFGSAKAPGAIRAASDSIESYSPLLDLDLIDSPFSDLGDADLGNGAIEERLDIISDIITSIMRLDGRPLSLGGEHTVTLPIVRAMRTLHQDLLVIHVDAHSDLRDSYEGTRINHATVMRRIHEILAPHSLIQLGIRAGTREEFGWMRERATLLHWIPGAERILLDRIGRRSMYLSLDLDVMDPSCLPGAGNPEAGGWFYHDLERLFHTLRLTNMIGADVVELNPEVDSSEVSSITAAKIVRELLLILGQQRPGATNQSGPL